MPSDSPREQPSSRQGRGAHLLSLSLQQACSLHTHACGCGSIALETSAAVRTAFWDGAPQGCPGAERWRGRDRSQAVSDSTRKTSSLSRNVGSSVARPGSRPVRARRCRARPPPRAARGARLARGAARPPRTHRTHRGAAGKKKSAHALLSHARAAHGPRAREKRYALNTIHSHSATETYLNALTVTPCVFSRAVVVKVTPSDPPCSDSPAPLPGRPRTALSRTTPVAVSPYEIEIVASLSPPLRASAPMLSWAPGWWRARRGQRRRRPP